jgi:hypothetical protein
MPAGSVPVIDEDELVGGAAEHRAVVVRGGDVDVVAEVTEGAGDLDPPLLTSGHERVVQGTGLVQALDVEGAAGDMQNGGIHGRLLTLA